MWGTCITAIWGRKLLDLSQLPKYWKHWYHCSWTLTLCVGFSFDRASVRSGGKAVVQVPLKKICGSYSVWTLPLTLPLSALATYCGHFFDLLKFTAPFHDSSQQTGTISTHLKRVSSPKTLSWLDRVQNQCQPSFDCIWRHIRSSEWVLKWLWPH